MSAFDWVVCPECRQELTESTSELRCGACLRSFPVCVGIPDFRQAAEYAGKWDEETALLPELVKSYDSCDLDGLLQIMLDGLARADEPHKQRLRDYFVLGLAERAAHRARVIDFLCVQSGRPADFSQSLEIGCGAGATLFELSRRGRAIGIDPNLLHLIIAKKHAQTLNLSVALVCGFAECLPFRDGTFGFVHSMHTVEHFSDQPKGLSEMRRVVSDDGLVCFDIPNRFSLWREPHTKVWGIGFVPRRWTALKVIKNQSLWALSGLMEKAFGGQFSIDTALVRFHVPGYRASKAIKLIARVLLILERAPVLRSVVRFFQPGFEVVACKSPLRQRSGRASQN